MNPRRDFSHIQRPIGVRGIRFRSKMEANYGAYLEWLRGLGQIAGWDYEPHTFWFDPRSTGAIAQRLAGIRRGVTSYKPDFRVYVRDLGRRSRFEAPAMTEWHETKGLMDSRSRVALARMKRYYPEEKVVVIDSKQMSALRRQVGGMVPGWLP